MEKWNKNIKRLYQEAPFRIVWKYALFGILWILFSDQILEYTVTNDAYLTYIQTAKGWLFVIVTSILLFILIVRHLKEIERKNTMFKHYEKRFERYFSFGLVGLAVVDDERRFVEVNHQLCNILATSKEIMVGKKLDAYVSDRQKIDYSFLDQIKRSEMADYKNECILLKDKDEVYVQMAIRGLLNEQGEIENYILAVEDINDLKNAQKKLIAINDQLEQVVEKRTGELLESNNQLKKSLKENEKNQRELIVLNQNLTESMKHLEETQRELIISERMAALGNLVTSFAHEMSTPIGSTITANSFLMDETQKVQEKFQENGLGRKMLENYFAMVDKTVHMTTESLFSVSELLSNYKNIAVNQTYFVKKVINVKTYVEKIVSASEVFTQNDIYTYEVKGQEAIEAETYPLALLQIISQLVNNAIVHGFKDQDAGHIIIDIQKNDKLVILKFSDDGCGMSDMEVLNVFEPFFTTEVSKKGAGLGLYIVYNIVTQKLRGDITCESQVGRGTDFFVTFPISPLKI